MTMLFRILHDDASGVLSYLLGDEATREAVLIDPRSSDRVVLDAVLHAERLQLRWILRTHDHDAAQPHEVRRLRAWHVPVVQGQARAGVTVPADGERLPFGNEAIQVIHTPGHTRGGLSFRWRDRVFCGGLLATRACPLQPQPEDAAALWDSVTRRLFTLPDETLLFAGHARRSRVVSTVQEQRRWHPQFAALSRDAYLARVAAKARGVDRAGNGRSVASAW
jgi:sulfur dioxygenase